MQNLLDFTSLKGSGLGLFYPHVFISTNTRPFYIFSNSKFPLLNQKKNELVSSK